MEILPSLVVSSLSASVSVAESVSDESVATPEAGKEEGEYDLEDFAGGGTDEDNDDDGYF